MIRVAREESVEAPNRRGERHPPAAPRLLVRDAENLPAHVFDAARLEQALRSGLGPRARDALFVRHDFVPRGTSLVVMGPSVRVALHTWPERGALCLDVYGTDPDLETLAARCFDALLGVVG